MFRKFLKYSLIIIALPILAYSNLLLLFIYFSFFTSCVILLVELVFLLPLFLFFRKKKVKITAKQLILFIIVVCVFLNLERLYTPSALNKEHFEVYSQCIKFAIEHNEYENLRFAFCYYWPNKFETYWLGNLDIFDRKVSNITELTKKIGETEARKLDELSSSLYEINCYQFQRIDNFILFYQIYNEILPNRPGVVYSFNGENPNLVEDKTFIELRPFDKISNNWYVSKKLLRTGLRYDIPESVPKALIDNSCNISKTLFVEIENFNVPREEKGTFWGR